MEPYWNQVRIQQVVCRGVRRNSHIALPESDRNVEVFRYFSTIPRKNMNFSKEKNSTDEYMDLISLKKQHIIDELTQILKECSFDCILNSPDIKGDYKCFSFGDDAEGLSYLPELSDDMIHSRTKNETKIKKIIYIKAIYCEGLVYLMQNKKFYLYNDDKKTSVELDIKKCKAIYVNKETNDVYDTKSIESGNPLKIGTINKDNKIVKKLK